MGRSHHILAACRASDGGARTRTPRAGASVPAVGGAVDAQGVRLVVGRVGRVLWRIHTRRAFRCPTDVSFARKGTWRGGIRRAPRGDPSDGPLPVGTRGTRQ